ncbi:MAG: hypothetical protein AAF416_22345 [Pseudomonadota bacterium]
MNMPDWIQPGGLGAVVGAIAVSAIGFSWGGWVTASSAEDMASQRAEASVVNALVPMCLDISRRDVDRAEKLVVIADAPKYSRRDALMKTGWATMPGMDGPDRDLAEACVASLELDAG